MYIYTRQAAIYSRVSGFLKHSNIKKAQTNCV